MERKQIERTAITVQGDFADDFQPAEVYYSWECEVIINCRYDVEEVRISYALPYDRDGEEIDVEPDDKVLERIKEDACFKALEKVSHHDFLTGEKE